MCIQHKEHQNHLREAALLCNTEKRYRYLEESEDALKKALRDLVQDELIEGKRLV